MKYSFKDIILIGRSMGTGPACAIAAEFKSIAALVLLSPYTSLKAATRSYMGSLLSFLVRERFDNLNAVKHAKCPTLIIHG
jgi:fermentation-respiration switch protein FrsA (DUF1100 family)